MNKKEKRGGEGRKAGEVGRGREEEWREEERGGEERGK